MSGILELVLELVLNVIGCLVEAAIDAWLSDDTRANRIFWSVLLVLLGGVIWWELR
jgi:hypothetical protein